MLQSKTSNQKAFLALAWTCFFWGTTWLASKQGVKYMPAIQLCAIRQFLGGSIYIIYFIIAKHPWPKTKHWASILMLSFLNFMLSNALSTWGVKYISSGLGAIIGAIFPLWLVIISLFNGEKLPKKAMLGLLLGFSGVCIIFFNHLKDFLNTEFSFGIMLSVIATISWAFGTLYTKKNAANFNPYFSIGLQMFISSIILFWVSNASGNAVSISKIPANSWWAIFYLVFIGSVFTFIAYIYSLQRLPTSLASLYAYVNPIVAVILGAIIFDEKLNIYIAVGGAVTITGLYLVNSSFKKKIEKS